MKFLQEFEAGEILFYQLLYLLYELIRLLGLLRFLKNYIYELFLSLHRQTQLSAMFAQYIQYVHHIKQLYY